MKWYALLVTATALCRGADAPVHTPRTFTGVIHDNRCVGANCATQCPVTKSPRYTLQSGEDAWLLSDQKLPARYAGKKVIVTGTVRADNILHETSIIEMPHNGLVPVRQTNTPIK